jgi:plasma kallikrein
MQPRSTLEVDCGIYSKICCQHEDILPEPQTVPAKVNFSCGNRNEKGVSLRISGATAGESEFGEFPWMVAVSEKKIILGISMNAYLCGGSIIHPSVVLTGKIILTAFK